MALRQVIGRSFLNFQGWKTRRKIIVIESDDWGSIRMPSKEVYTKCLKAGYPVDKIAYERYDSLLSQDDLELLFDLLTSFRDKNGNHPVITANCVVANPDFDKIKQNNFQKYSYELINETFKHYPKHADNFKIWKQGIENRIFVPQYHGREHLNVSLFMNSLFKGDHDVHFGFSNKMPGIITKGALATANYYVEATRYNSLEDKYEKKSIFLDGLEIFEKLFGYRSKTIIPPNYIWSPDFDEAVFEKGVNFFQGIRLMHEPIPGCKPKTHTTYLGKRNKFGQIYLVRNVFFEPSLFRLRIKDPVSACLSNMDLSFKMRKPAVICSHRINYVGYIDEKNRDRTLQMLSLLITKALKTWPDIEFMTSYQLGNAIDSQEY